MARTHPSRNPPECDLLAEPGVMTSSGVAAVSGGGPCLGLAVLAAGWIPGGTAGGLAPVLTRRSLVPMPETGTAARDGAMAPYLAPPRGEA